VPLSRSAGTCLTQCGLHGGLLPYQVASSSIQLFGHNSVGCHLLCRNISTNYYFVVEIHDTVPVTVCSDDAWYLLNKSSAVAEKGDRGHNRHGPKGGGERGCCAPFAECQEPD